MGGWWPWGEDRSRLGRCLSFLRVVAGTLFLALTLRRASPDSLLLAGIAGSYLLFGVGTFLASTPGSQRPGRDRLLTGIDLLTALLVFVFYSVSPGGPALLLFPFVVFELAIRYRQAGLQFAIPLFAGVAFLRVTTVVLQTGHFLPRWPDLATLVGISLGLAVLAGSLCSADDDQEQALRRQDGLCRGYQAALGEVLASQGLALEELPDGELGRILAALPAGTETEAGSRLGLHLVGLMQRQQERMPRLTHREREVLALMAQGLSYARIARSLLVSEGTVRAHAAGVLRKMEARNRQDAVALARRLHIV